MNRKVIQILVALITCVLVGMVALQLYWIRNSMNLRETEFKHEIHSVLDDVVLELEKKENLDKLGMGESSDPFMIEMGAKTDRGLEISFKNTIQDQVVESETIQLEDEVLGSKTDELMADQMGDFGKNQSEILKQTELFDDILGGNVSVQIVKGIAERIDLKVIDSLIRAGLLERSIKTPFYFGVFDEKKQPFIIGENDADFTGLLKGDLSYSAKLFPKELSPKTYFLRLFFPKQKQYLFHSMDKLLIMSILILVAIFAAFYYSIKTIFRQKKLGEMKNDFINNMTHELKTPISTISLACEALKDPDMRGSDKQMNTFINMINSENKRLGVLVENVLRSALLDSEEMPLKINKVNLNELVSSVTKSLAIRVKKHDGKISASLDVNTPFLEGDSVHLTNMIYNLLDNAIKYSPEEPIISISTENRENEVVLEVQDSGIGISKENQKKIFDKLYRVPTGNVHDVKGFGLGLNYVQVIVEKHKGEIQVQSELKKGSKFTIIIPKNHEKHH